MPIRWASQRSTPRIIRAPMSETNAHHPIGGTEPSLDIGVFRFIHRSTTFGRFAMVAKKFVDLEPTPPGSTVPLPSALFDRASPGPQAQPWPSAADGDGS